MINSASLIHFAGQSQQEIELKKSAYTANSPIPVQWEMPNFDTVKNKWTIKGYIFPQVDLKSN